MVMQHRDDSDYICKMTDAVPTSRNPFVASTTVPGVLNLIPVGSPHLSEAHAGAAGLPVPSGVELYVLGGKKVKPGVSENTLAHLLKGLPVADSAGETTEEGSVLQLLK